MKIAITDACIFIDLYDLELTLQFFSLDLDVHTSLDVFNELYKEQQQILQAFMIGGKLSIHNISEEERSLILSCVYPRALSEMDKTVLFLAQKHEAMVLSSDQVVRKFAKNKAIEVHGMLWIFDRLVEEKQIPPNLASLKLRKLIATNLMYQSNKKLADELQKRLKSWGEK